MTKLSKVRAYGNAVLISIIGIYFFLIPAITLVSDTLDPGLRSGETPQFTYRWHRQLSDKFETWARERVASGQAAQMSTRDISGTEWPIFSAVYYLWSTEALQAAWEENPATSKTMPAEYARGAIEAAIELVTDPNHASWVIKHWGSIYLERENVFYRMLYISGMTSYQNLTGDERYQAELVAQIDSLSAELDASPYGLLDDYPNQCYPVDILPAIAVIQRADRLLGTDHSAFIDRAVRAFEDTRLDPLTQLPGYFADSRSGMGLGPARGVGMSYMLVWAPELWPDTAEQWYTHYEDQFWQQNWFAAGFREFSNQGDYPEWAFLDVDAGPVLAGWGTAASGFGIAAARTNGRLDQAYPVSAEALLFAWQMPDGTMLGARALSNLSDAPYLGETILLFTFTRTPVVNETVPAKNPIRLPLVFYLGMIVGVQCWVSSLFLAKSEIRKAKSPEQREISVWRFAAWAGLILLGVTLLLFGKIFWGTANLMAALMVPRNSKKGRFSP